MSLSVIQSKRAPSWWPEETVTTDNARWRSRSAPSMSPAAADASARAQVPHPRWRGQQRARLAHSLEYLQAEDLGTNQIAINV